MPRAKTPPHGPRALGRLRELVEADGRPKAQIAEAAGMSRSQLQQVLSPERELVTVTVAARILAALDCSWADLD